MGETSFPNGIISRGVPIIGAPLKGSVYFVDAVNGNNSNGGTSWQDAKLTIAAAVALCTDGDTILLSGKTREENVIIPNTVGGIAIVGVSNGQPSHGDAPWAGGSASWLPPSSPTAATPLLVIRSQG